MNVLAIDQGTSSTKALVVCPNRGILATAEAPVHPRCGTDGSVEQDPEALWESVVAAGCAAVGRAGERVGVVGFANQGETVLAWDRATGRPLSAAISWQDRRAVDVCAALHERAPALTAITGLAVDPYFAAPKMRWLRDHATRDGVCTTTDAWLLHRLTGAYVTDAATASRTLLLDLDRVTWSGEACEAFGIDPTTLPAIVDCAGVVGETTVFGAPVPVAGVAVDQQAALFAQECRSAGDAKCTYGTGAFLLATVGPRAQRSRSGLAACVAWRLDGAVTYCLDGQVYTAGAVVAWLERIGLIDGPRDLDRLGMVVADSGGVTFVPALAGLGAPFGDPLARGTFAGLSLATERGHLVRATIEGIAAQVAWLARAVADDLGAPLTRLRVDGGLTRSALLMQIQADLLQMPVEVAPAPDATALGVAALAWRGIGEAQDGFRLPGRGTTFEPRIAPADAAERLARWRTVVGR